MPGLDRRSRPRTPYDAKGLLKTAIRCDDPVIFLESEMMLNDRGEVPEGEYTIPIGVADVKKRRRRRHARHARAKSPRWC